jgi:hypothetical protein
MTAATKNTAKATAAETEQIIERIRDLNEQVIEVGRKAGVGFLDAYEQTARTFADYQDRVADNSQIDWVTNIARAQANFTREVIGTYTSIGREYLK